MSLRALLLLFLLLCLAIGREHVLAVDEEGGEEDDVEPGEEEGEEEKEDIFDSILKEVTVASLTVPSECKHRAERGDRIYLEYAGIEHATGEVFSANTRAGQMALIVRLGEKTVLPGK